jgi:predicted dehydrogenase
MEKTFNWGVLGAGRIAHKFVQDLLTLPNVRLHAVASTSLQRAEAFAHQYGAPHAYGSYGGLLTCPDLDVVYIATPHHGHAENTVMLLENRIPVLCEKPLAINGWQVSAMLDAAERHQTYLMEALWTRFLPKIQRVLGLVEEGAIGKLQAVKADFGFRKDFDPTNRVFDARQGGGSLLDVGIYPIFLAYLLLGKPQTVKAVARLGPTGVDETCAILFQYPGNELAMLDSAITTVTPCEALLFGTEGTLKLSSRWHEPGGDLLLTRYDGTEPQRFPYEREGFGYQHEAAAVMADLAAGRTENALVSRQLSRDLMDIMDAVRREAGIFYEGID